MVLYDEIDVVVDEANKMVNVLDLASASLIVSLSYKDELELCSDEFQQLIRDAVAVQCASEGEGWEQVSRHRHHHDLPGCDTSHLANSDDSDNSDDGFWDVMTGECVNGPCDDVMFIEETGTQLEVDFEVALRLQEEEDRIASGQRRGEKSSTMVTKSWGGERVYGARSNVIEHGKDDDEFPALPPGGPARFFSSSPESRRCGLSERKELEEGNGTRCVSHKDDLSGYVKLSDIRGFLVDEMQEGERMSVLCAASASLASSPSKGVSLDDMRRMMVKTSKDDRAAKMTHVEKLLREGPDREMVSRKSIEKLQRQMMDYGWHRVRQSNHYIYQRLMPVPLECGGQGKAPPIKQQVRVDCATAWSYDLMSAASSPLLPLLHCCCFFRVGRPLCAPRASSLTTR